MGGNLSVDFSYRVQLMQKKEFGPEDHDHWKVLFLTSLTLEEVATYLNPAALRRIRRSKPHNLALLLHKSMQQMALYVEDTRRHRKIIDDCAVMNALRIVSVTMAIILEENVVDGDAPESPHARFFAQSFFWQNSACRPEGEAAATLPSVLRPAKGPAAADQVSSAAAAPRAFVPLGEELMVLLTRLSFVPGFTLDGHLPPIDEAALDFNSPELKGHHVLATHLQCEGLFSSAVAEGNLVFRQDVKRRRYELLRCIIACLTTPVAVGRSMAPNPFLDAFVSFEANPLAPTLCCSMVNYVSQYVSRGVLPFTSHYWVELPEAFLAECLQLLALCLHFPDGTSPNAVPPPETRPQQQPDGSNALLPCHRYYADDNCFWRFISHLALDEGLAAFLVNGVYRLVENPLFAATTVLKGSQRVINCVNEALNLQWRLFFAPTTRVYRDLICAASDAMLFPWLFYTQLAKIDRQYFPEAECVMQMVLAASAEDAFVAIVDKPFDGVMPFRDLPAVQPGATYGDVLVLVMCDLMGPASPKWLRPLVATAALIVANVAPQLVLQEQQHFEVFHSVDFITTNSFLLRSKRVDHETVLVAMTDALVVLCSKEAGLPLLGSLSTINVAARLRALCADGDIDAADATAVRDGEQSLAIDVRPAARSATENDGAAAGGEEMPAAAPLARDRFVLSQEAKSRLQLQAVEFYSALAHEHVAGISASDVGDGASVDPLCRLRAQSLLPPQPLAVVRRAFVATEAALRFAMSSLWAVIHRHNIRPPLFDLDNAKLFAPPVGKDVAK